MQKRWIYRVVCLCFLAAFILFPPSALAQTAYVGSAKCESCHQEIYAKWKDTLHNKSQQDLSPSNDAVVVAWKGIVKLPAWNNQEVTIKMNKTADGKYEVTMACSKDPAREQTYTVVRTYGGWGWKQRYHVKIGNNHYILPNQWNQETSKWVPYNLQNWYGEDCAPKKPTIDKSFEMKCAGCHNTGLELTKVDGGYESKYVELNIGCEKCHGPGSTHVNTPEKGNVIHPRKLAYERGLEVCGQCHNRGVSRPHGLFEFPWNDKDNKPYKLGEPLANYFEFKPGKWGNPEGHSKNHHQQWIDFVRSKHFTGKVTCFDCHDAHGGPGRAQLVQADYNNRLCLSCHRKDQRFSSTGPIREHTKHNYAPETMGTSRCSTCHMVKTASSAEAGDIHAHNFRIIHPQISLDLFKKDPKSVIPNSCNGCHKEWAKNEAGYQAGVKAYETLFKK